MRVRKALTSDKEQLVELRLALQLHLERSNPAIWRITKEGKQKLVEDIDQLLADTEGLFLVAEQDRAIMGFAYGKTIHRREYQPNRVGVIDMIFVQQGRRRRGVGTQLIREFCKFFKTQTVRDVTLRYVLGNKEAEAFWAHLGFKPIIHTVNTDVELLEKCLQK